jgi:acyl carrier protein
LLAVYTFFKSRYIFTRLPKLPPELLTFRPKTAYRTGCVTDGAACLRKEQTVEEKVISIVSEQLSVSKDEITRDSSFIDDLHADSLDLVELGMKFEEEFGVSIPDEDYEKLRTVGDAIDYIKQRESA